MSITAEVTNTTVPTPSSTTATPIQGGDGAGVKPSNPSKFYPNFKHNNLIFFTFLLFLFLGDTFFSAAMQLHIYCVSHIHCFHSHVRSWKTQSCIEIEHIIFRALS